jgi:hypothetical protein
MPGFRCLMRRRWETRFGVLADVFLGDNGCHGVSVSVGRWQSVASSERWKNQSWPPAYDQCQMSSDLSSSASSVTWSGRLTPERIKTLAECLIEGRTRAEIADALRVSPRTVSRWKKHPVVVAEVDRLRSRANEPRVEDVLIRLLKSDDEHIRLMAVRETLRWEIQRARVEPEPERGVEEGYILVRQEPFR